MSPLLITGFAYLSFLPLAEAVLIDKRVTIQPIFLSNGTAQANPTGKLFEAEADKVWSQAGIDIQFLTPKVFASSTFYNLISNPLSGNNSLLHLTQTAGNGASTDNKVVNLWFVNTINGGGVLGYTLQTEVPFGFVQTQNGIAISNGGLGQADTLAHELGHTLGLYDSGNDDANGGVVVPTAQRAKNLMTESSYPSTIANIYPDGTQLSQLNAAQISRARSISTFVQPLATPYEYSSVPEPSQYAMVAGTLLGSFFFIRRRLTRNGTSKVV